MEVFYKYPSLQGLLIIILALFVSSVYLLMCGCPPSLTPIVAFMAAENITCIGLFIGLINELNDKEGKH